MRVFVGLGNPGADYEGTRHNVGFAFIDRLAEKAGVELDQFKHNARFGKGRMIGQPVLLVKPMTYMNLSGQAVAPLLRASGIEPKELLVVCDDMNLPLGQLRLRRRGGDGGHNGLASIIEALGTEAYPRLRAGIDRGSRGGDVGYVLGQFSAEEAPEVEDMVETAVTLARDLVRMGDEFCMNKYNRRDLTERQPKDHDKTQT